MRLTLVVIGILPLISLSVLGKSRIFMESVKKETVSTVRKEVTPTLDEAQLGEKAAPSLDTQNN